MDADQKQCSNCGEFFSQSFCSSCGQRDKEFEPSLKDWVHAVWDDFLFVDAKLINSFKALFKPGVYTQNWLIGKQVRYVHPVRLYIFLSVLYGVLSSLLNNGGDFYGGFFEALLSNNNESNLQDDARTRIIQIVSIITLPLSVICAQLYDRQSKIIKSVFFVVNLYSAFLILLIAANLLTLVVANLSAMVNETLATIVSIASLLFVIQSAKVVYSLGQVTCIYRTFLWLLASLVFFFAISIISIGYYEAHATSHQNETVPFEEAT